MPPGSAHVVSDEIRMQVNGAAVAIAGIEPRTRLADFLRDRVGLTSVHLGCEQGVCGACTVLMNGSPVKSCIVFAFQAREASIETVEGLSGAMDDIHPMQAAFRSHYALQCGFCTPGMIMSACGLLRANPHPDEDDIRDAISGNLCRCTGYQPIIEAIEDVAASGAMAGER
jgi:carbon-monoxide dehydrogenase small subunit